MTHADQPLNEMLGALQERAKELNCLYQVDDVLSRRNISVEEALESIVRVIPPGWQYPEVCHARVTWTQRTFETPGFPEGQWVQREPILIAEEEVGGIEVAYAAERPEQGDGPFLTEERRLLGTIAGRVGQFLERRRGGERVRWDSPERTLPAEGRQEWGVIVDFLRRTDRALLLRVTRKMINHLCWHGVGEAQAVLLEFAPVQVERESDSLQDNRPSLRKQMVEIEHLIDQTFWIAGDHLNEREIIQHIQRWIQEDKTGNLTSTLESSESSLSEVASALAKYKQAGVDESELPGPMKTELHVSLLRRFFADRFDLVEAAQDHVEVSDFVDLVERVIASPGSRGKLGGKSAGLFIGMKLASEAMARGELPAEIRAPKTWYVASDAIMDFIRLNNLEDLFNRKYMKIDQIRQDYPHIVQLFKSSRFPLDIVKGLSMALDDIEDYPLIVRSSSLLEDSVGAAFSGKYKSLFLANKGTKRERLEALQDAIAEVYASVFGPDPIEYRAERGLLHEHEEMAIMIQQVVGRRVGRFFMPTFSGVAFSSNEFRWSPRIRRRDGLARLVPGLGTRAVDRVSDDYPVLIAPGQPDIRVNSNPDEVVRYSPMNADVINLETGQFETVKMDDLLKEAGREYPLVHRVVSRWADGRLVRPLALGLDFESDQYVVTFDGLCGDTGFVDLIRTLLAHLEEELGLPVDIEFAADGEDIYLLQCRAQSHSPEVAPAPIPRNLPRDRLLFTAHQYISNGQATNLTHVVYVDPDEYDALTDRATLLRVGRAIGGLNRILPKRQFLLMGPGRWGSRGDIKLGVNVTYSDINNTSVLSEIARKKGQYSPDLSFGTHFFQDLVESGIRYLPLYPDEPENIFNELFLKRSPNLLDQLLPEFGDLANVVRVIDVARSTDGGTLHILMNADLREAVGMFGEPTRQDAGVPVQAHETEAVSEDHWRWREFMAERIAATIDRERWGIVQLYVFGSTKNATAGPGSDIDLLVHFRGEKHQREEVETWLGGWSRCLAEINFLRTGYRSDGLLDVHVITDRDIARKTSFAVKINAITDQARPLLAPAAAS